MLKIKPLESIAGLNKKIQAAVLKIPIRDHYFIALSGGLDSVALLYFSLPFLKKHAKKIEVIHINHGLSESAVSWATFCAELCQCLGLDLHIENVSVLADGSGIEAAARKSRYAVFERYLEQGGLLLQGHHLNDQAETVLMRLFKGLGPEALKGIPQSRVLSKGAIFRPWLSLSRDVLSKDVTRLGLSWVEDESNLDLRFDRNYIRNQVLPFLKERRTTIIEDLSNAAKKAQASSDFINEWCESQEQFFLCARYADEQALDIATLRTYTELQKQFTIRYWLDLHGIAHPAEKNFNRIIPELLSASTDSQAEVSWHNILLRVFDGALFCLPRGVNKNDSFHVQVSLDDLRVKEDRQIAISLPFGELLISLDVQSIDISSSQVKINSNKIIELACQIPISTKRLSIRSRQGGEKMYISNDHSTELKKLYQTKKVLPWYRDKLPLVYIENQLICSLAGFVAGAFYCKGDLIQDGYQVMKLSFSLR